MKRILLTLILCLNLTITFAAPINNIVFFGDSLSDNGNLYKLLLHAMPKSPPYFQGRFSNGPTWAEIIAKYFYDKYSADSHNYAVGGATAIYHAPSDKFATLVTLNMELDKFYLENLFKDKSKTLFVIWIGDNDYLFDNNVDPETGTAKVVNAVSAAMDSLADHGAKYFLLINLVDASRTPLIRETGSAEKVQHLVTIHNQKLAVAIEQFTNRHPAINLLSVSMDQVFSDFIDDPEKFNQKYHVNVQNTFSPCWQGGFFLQQSDTQSSELALTAAMGKSFAEGNLPCSNPDNYLFWDIIHPTAVVHTIIAQIVQAQLENSFYQDGQSRQP